MNNISTGAKAGDRRKSNLAQLEIDLRTPLYDTPSRELEENHLRVALDLLEMKARHRWSDLTMDDLFRWLKKCFLKDNTCASSLNEAKKIMCPLNLSHTKYHACVNDCIIYQNEHVDETTCPVCKADRYKRGTRKAHRKVVWYFPLMQRYFADSKEANLMLWHSDRKAVVFLDPKWVEDPVLTHPSDASQWRALDEEYYKECGRDPRNIRLGASTDGLNPFGNQSSKHNTWLVSIWMYNIPLVVPEEDVHTHEYANSRDDTATERYQPVSRVVEGRVRPLWEEGVET
jgi:hypothetical protein